MWIKIFKITILFFIITSTIVGVSIANEDEDAANSFRNSPANNYIISASRYYSQWKLNEAAEEAEKARQLDPNNPYVYGFLGQVYKDMRNYGKALEVYQKGISLKSNLLGALNGIGDIYRAQGKYDLAEKYFKEVIAQDLNFYAAYHNLGVLYKDKKNYDKAIEYFKKVIDINPDVHQSYGELGYLYIRIKKYPDAIENFKKYVKFMPTAYYGLYGLGLAYMANGDDDLAKDTFNEALKAKPNAKEAKDALGVINNTQKRRSDHLLSMKDQFKKDGYHVTVEEAAEINAMSKKLAREKGIDPIKVGNTIIIRPQYYEKGKIPVTSTERKLVEEYGKLAKEIQDKKLPESDTRAMLHSKVQELIKQYNMTEENFTYLLLKVSYGEVTPDSYMPPTERIN